MTIDFDAVLLAELNGPDKPKYDAAGWSQALPPMVGDPTADPRVPFTQADNDARAAQADKYTAIAAIVNDATDPANTKPLPMRKVNEEQLTAALDEDEWKALAVGRRDYLKTLQGTPEYVQAMIRALSGVTRTALGLLRESTGESLSLRRVKAGDIKRVKGDTI